MADMETFEQVFSLVQEEFGILETLEWVEGEGYGAKVWQTPGAGGGESEIVEGYVTLPTTLLKMEGVVAEFAEAELFGVIGSLPSTAWTYDGSATGQHVTYPHAALFALSLANQDYSAVSEALVVLRQLGTELVCIVAGIDQDTQGHGQSSRRVLARIADLDAWPSKGDTDHVDVTLGWG